MTNQIINSNPQTKYDLEDRTIKFAEDIVNYAKNFKINPFNSSIISQLIRAGTSVGANYSEANECVSKKDFCHKISLAKKEAKETMYWLKIMRNNDLENKHINHQLSQESHELVLIFSAILKKTKI